MNTKIIRLLIIIVSVAIFASATALVLNGNNQNKNDNPPSKEEISKQTTPHDTIPESTSEEKISYTPNPNRVDNGKLKGVIMLGSAGFDSFIIKINKNKDWNIKNKEFGISLIKEGLATKEYVEQEVRKYIEKMSDFGVKGKDIHFIISSGALKEENSTPIIAGIRRVGYVVNEVNYNQEAKLGFKATVPNEIYNNAFFIDIGSGNTKIAWYNNAGRRIETRETYGAKYYKDDLLDRDIYDDVREIIKSIPVANRKNCMIIGGVPFKMAKQVRKEKERYTKLLSPDHYDGKEKKMYCGLNIYKAIKDETQCNNFLFDWDSNFTIGFLLSLPY